MYRSTKLVSRRLAPSVLAAALACILAGSAVAQNDSSGKVQVGATDTKLLKANPLPPGMPTIGPHAAASSSGVVELASTTVHTPEADDLSILFTSECFVYTQGANATLDQGTTHSEATVTTWIEIDGQPVPVAAAPAATGQTSVPPDDGKIGLCARSQTLNSTLADQEAIDLANLTHAAHAFAWTAFGVGAGNHTIRVMGRLDSSVDGTGSTNAAAVIGKRTLQVDLNKQISANPVPVKPAS